VKNGELVRSGDPIAKVDRVTVMAAIASTQEEMADLAKQLEEARLDSTGETIRSPGGLIKHVYAQSGDSVETVMLTHGALAVISLDEKMAVTLEGNFSLLAGDPVTVVLDDQQLSGTVEMNRSGVLTVLLPDKGYAPGAQVGLMDRDGNLLGQGVLEIHNPWTAVAYSGTVGQVYAREGRQSSKGSALLTIRDMGYSAEYRSLAARHRAYEEQLTELFKLYQTLTLTAPGDGMVSGIDEDSPQLLSARGTWSLSLLSNSPDGRDDAQYLNFTGQVRTQGSDGWIIAVNPQFLSITDYTDLSGVPRDPALMTQEVVYTGGAPVYQWTGEEWITTSFSVGDLLLFAGDASGNIVWIIRMGSAQLPTDPTLPPDQTDPTEPTVPSDPTEPTVPSDPTDPPAPTEPVPPSDPTEPTVPTDPTLPSEPSLPGGTGGLPGGIGGLPSGITLPSFGGYGGGYGNYGGQQELPQEYGTETVEVATVTPQETMTLPITVDELDLHLVEVGAQVTVTVEALAESSFPGRITSIDRIGTNGGGSSKFTVTVTLDRADNMLPGMNAAVTLELSTADGLAIPVEALSREGGMDVVFTALNEEGRPAAPREVTLGPSDGAYVIVTTGLSQGETVYYTYYEALDTGLPPMPSIP